MICGFSPSELLNGRQIRTKIDTLLPSLTHNAHEKQCKDVAKSSAKKKARDYEVGDAVYTKYFGPRNL